MYDTDSETYVYDSVVIKCRVRFVDQSTRNNIMFDEIRDCKSKRRILTNLTLTSKDGSQCKMQFKLDTGVAGNLLPYREFNKIFPDVSIKDLHRSIDPDVTLEAYNGSCINQLGTCKLNISGASKELCQAIFFVMFQITVIQSWAFSHVLIWIL